MSHRAQRPESWSLPPSEQCLSHVGREPASSLRRWCATPTPTLRFSRAPTRPSVPIPPTRSVAVRPCRRSLPQFPHDSPRLAILLRLARPRPDERPTEPHPPLDSARRAGCCPSAVRRSRWSARCVRGYEHWSKRSTGYLCPVFGTRRAVSARTRARRTTGNRPRIRPSRIGKAGEVWILPRKTVPVGSLSPTVQEGETAGTCPRPRLHRVHRWPRMRPSRVGGQKDLTDRRFRATARDNPTKARRPRPSGPSRWNPKSTFQPRVE